TRHAGAPRSARGRRRRALRRRRPAPASRKVRESLRALEHLAKPLESEPDPRLDRSERLLEPLRDLRLRESSVVRQREHLALVLGQLTERTENEIPVLCPLGRIPAGIGGGGRHPLVDGGDERLTSSTDGTYFVDCPGA